MSNREILSATNEALSIIASVFTIFASGIAIYIFFFKKKDIELAFRLLTNYAYQTTLSELKEKLERLNEYKTTEESGLNEIIYVFHEICGQIKGNPKLKHLFSDYVEKVESATSGRKKLEEAKKRMLVSELRERIKHLNINSINNIVEDE